MLPTSSGPGRLLIHPPSAGAWNMAVDEVLLESSGPHQICLRFYSWTPATLSLGYFQDAEQRLSHPPSRACPFVRRASGGGAIMHQEEHHELTYSIVMPIQRGGRGAHRELYDLLHVSLIRSLSHAGIVARLCEDPVPLPDEKPFLCFQRLTAGDVLIDQHKVAGSAQRRSATAVLQHGSVLLRRSPHAPELPGICDLTELALTAGELRDRWLIELNRLCPLNWQPDELSAAEISQAGNKVATKFGDHRWTLRR